MSKSITVELHAHDKVKKCSVPQLMLLPYRSATHVTKHYMGHDETNSLSGKNRASPHNSLSPTSQATSQPVDPSLEGHVSTAGTDGQTSENHPTMVLAISMPQDMGIRSWRWYEATTETLAVGVYLYATFVLTSTQFLSGSTGLAFFTIMAVCSSAVRILENIFWSPR